MAAPSPAGPLFLGHDIYRNSTYGSRHPLAIPRVPAVIDLCRALGWLDGASYRTSPRARPAALHAFHTPAYVAALQAAEAAQAVSDDTRRRHGLGTLSNPVYPEMFRRPATSAGGALLAAELVAHGGTVFHPAGGTHHGLPDRANGFCFLNDPVLAIMALRRLGVDRVAYVDIDAHHCDGVAHAFADVPEVLMVSTHEAGRWPFTGALDDRLCGNALNLPMERGAGDGDATLALDAVILPAVQAHRPGAIVLQCGSDALAEDPLSRLEWTNAAHRRAVAALMGLGIPMLVTGGGGYNPWSVARCWSGIWAVVSGQEIPERLDPQVQAVLRALSWNRRAGQRPPEHWFTTLADPPGAPDILDSTRASVAALRAQLNAVI